MTDVVGGTGGVGGVGVAEVAEAPSSAERLRDEALRFLRRFGLVSAVWATLLAAAVPDPGAGRPGVLWTGIGIAWAWALVSQVVGSPYAWWGGWFVVASGLELLGPLAATDGWSVTGGASFIVLAGVALTTSRTRVVAVVAWLSFLAVLRGSIAAGWNVGGSVGTILIFGFGGLALTWLARLLLGVLEDRDALQQRLRAIETEQVREHERRESAARLHDTVLQHLTAVTHADGVDEARRQAGRASNELRQFLRAPDLLTVTFKQHLEESVTRAADGIELSVNVAGQRELDDPARLLVDATVEAVRNAARHAGGPVRVFAETDRVTTTVWVTDRGSGFDLDDVPADRLGVRDSIVGRLDRAGGSATVRSDGGGTEWELTLPVSD